MNRLVLAAARAAVIAISLAGLAAQEVEPVAVQVPADLGGPDRYLAHLATDRPTYRPGEIVYGRAAVLQAFTRAPLPDSCEATFEVRSPRGDVVATGNTAVENGVAAFSWTVPAGQAGGEHKLVAKFPDRGFPDSETTFLIRAYRVPRLKTDLQFVRKAYGPGDEVSATLSVKRAEGGIPAGAQVEAVATVDGREVHRSQHVLDAAGGLAVAFKLPPELDKGEGNLALVVRDGGVQETAVKSIPIVLNKVALVFYPEGGDLVAGLEARVYFEARNTKDLPADVAGRIVDSDGQTVAKFKSEHEGRGRVFLTPKAGLLYHAALDEPAGVRQHFPLPAVSEQGLVLTAGQDIVPAEGRLHLKVASTGAGPVTVVVSRYEKEIRKETVALETGAAKEVALQLGGEAAGVLRVTALDSSGTPRAERLVLRQPKKAVQVKVSAAPEKSSPGGKVTVQISTTDETGEPIAATVLLSAVDDALLETIEKRERAPRLPVQVLLGAEVRELADSHVYLAGGDEAARRTDLLLGTQGWRRLVFKDPAAFVKAHGEKARRALALKTAPVALLDELGFAGGAPRAMAPGALGGADIEKAEAVAAPEMAVPQRAVPAPPPPPALDAVGAPAEQDARAANLEPAAQPAMADADVGVAEREEIAPAQAVGAVAKMRQLRAPRFAAPALAFVREYAHRAQASAQRRDFAETLYWNAALMTDAKGQGSVAFELSDSVTTFRLRADAVSKAGGLGEGDAAIESRKPFYVEAKLPLEVTAGDRPLVPVSLVNGTEEKLEATLAAELTTGIALAGEAPAPVALGPGGRGKVYLPLEVAAYQGETRLRVRGTAGAFKDEAARKIAVVPAGFPVELNFGGRLEQEASLEIAIPPGVDPASVRTQGALHPSPLAVLTQALSALLQEPCGCFEQASSSNYPNVMIMQYLKGHRVDDAELLNRTNGLLESGYSRLAGYECKSKGYEWFGGDPGHEALSAYGLMQFVDMSQVYPVDKTMVERTRSWLLARRDGKGGFERNLRSLDSFGAAPPEITDAYILWSLCEAGEKGLDKEIARMKERASASDDPYYLGLAANILQRSGDGGAASVLDRLVRFQDKDGHVAGAKTSITRSSDENLDIETTSLASLAWLRSPAHTARVEKAMEWLLERCKGGRFGATQATVLALKAVLAYDVARSRPKRAGTAVVSLDGKIVDEVPFTPERQGAIEFPSFAKQLTPGTHKLELKMTEGSPMPYSVQVVYHASKPASSPKCQVGLTTKLAKAEVAEGETVDLTAELVNREKQGLPMTVAIVGLPGGLETRPDQLKELTKDGTIDFYETRGREVILYRRSMAPGEKRAVVLNLVAAIPGTYEGPASRAYLYYTDEHKDWAEGLKVKVTPSTVK